MTSKRTRSKAFPVVRERENRELRRAGEILRKASACFARAEPGSGVEGRRGRP